MWSGRNQRFVSTSSDLETLQVKVFFPGKTWLRSLVGWTRHSGQSSAGGKFLVLFLILYLQLAMPGLHVQLHINGHGGGSRLQGRIIFPLQCPILTQSNSGWKDRRPDGVIPGVRQELWSPSGCTYFCRQNILFLTKFLLFKEFLFDPYEDLIQLKDIPKVTRCLALMAKMVENNSFF